MEATPYTAPAEETVPESVPETNPEETSPTAEEAPAEQTENAGETPAEERPSRSQERISTTIAQRKAAEAAAEKAREEAQYWRDQALAAKQQTEPDDLEGVTDEGIDPLKFAASLEKKLEAKLQRRIEETRGMTAAQESFQKELLEARSDPALKSELAQKAVSRIINSEKVTPLEALAIYKEELEELTREASRKNKARNEAGQYVREQTQTPSAGRGSSGTDTTFTREQIAGMDEKTYAANQEEIHKQLAAGLIK